MSAPIRRSLAALAIAGILLLAGCGGSNAEDDAEVTVYLSAPLSGPRADEGRDIADAARLALVDAGGEAAGTPVNLEVLDDADGEGWRAALTGANARAATQDSTTIAYIGELDSGASRTSIPITHEAGILQVSPGSGAEDLTRESSGSDDVPAAVQPSGVRTFGRVIPSDRVQGLAAGTWIGSDGTAAVLVVGGSDPYGASLLAGLESAPEGPSPVAAGSRGEATYLVETQIDASVGVKALQGSDGPIYASDALLEPEGLAQLRVLAGTACKGTDACRATARPIRLTSAALAPTQLPESAGAFLEGFEAAYERPPGRFAAYGYEAMAAVLDSIDRAENPLDRAAVVDAFFAISERESVLGIYTIDEVGDTTLSELGAYELRDGRVEPLPEALPAS